MTTEIFLEILRQVVVDFDEVERRQVNSFALVWDWPNLQTPSWGKVYEDYLSGHFWSRHWENEGANPDTLRGDWPAVFVEPGEVVKDLFGDREVMKFTILFIDKKDCEGCGVRSAEDVRQGLLDMIGSFLKELRSYIKVEVDEVEMWVSLGRLVYMLDELMLDVVETGESIGGHLQVDNEVVVKNWAPMGDLVGMFFELEVDLCNELESGFKYDREVLERLAVVKCKNC